MRADILFVFVFKQKTAYEMRISDWSSDVCSSDLMGLTLLPALTTMRKIRAAGLADNACFVMIGGRNDRVSAVEALDAGADDHVVKPFDFDLLDARLRHLCARAEQVGALARRSEEHTSELQSLMRISYAVFCLKKKKNT